MVGQKFYYKDRVRNNTNITTIVNGVLSFIIVVVSVCIVIYYFLDQITSNLIFRDHYYYYLIVAVLLSITFKLIYLYPATHFEIVDDSFLFYYYFPLPVKRIAFGEIISITVPSDQNKTKILETNTSIFDITPISNSELERIIKENNLNFITKSPPGRV